MPDAGSFQLPPSKSSVVADAAPDFGTIKLRDEDLASFGASGAPGRAAGTLGQDIGGVEREPNGRRVCG